MNPASVGVLEAAGIFGSLFRKETQHPLLIRNNAAFDVLDQDKPLSEYEFTVLDTELTGLNPKTDEIVSVGAVKIRNMSLHPCDCMYSLVHPRMDMPKLSMLIHRITPEEVKGKPRLHNLLPKVVEFCRGTLLVGHYIGLDVGFLNTASKNILGGILKNPCIDTLRLAQAYEEERWEDYYDRYQLNVSFNLTALAERYGLPMFEEHNALQDAIQTAYLFLYLAKKLKRGGVETLRDLYVAGKGRRWLF